MASIVYHSKIMFNEDGDINSGYKRYFNILTWFLLAAKEEDKMRAFNTQDYPLSYKITPFALDFIKYALRAFVNDVHKIVDSSIKDEIKDSHSKKEMENSEWLPLSKTLSDEIRQYLEKIV
jgi:hypothetical protein